MKFLQRIAAALLVMGLALGVSAGCAAGETTLSVQERVYAQARELGYDGTLDEFLRLVAGKDGADGRDGASISAASVNEKGELIVTLTDGTVVNAGSVRGEKGDKGEQGERGDKGEDGADGKDGENGVDGQNGADGLNGQDGQDGKNGENGKDGAGWHFGAGAPDATLGNCDDLYLDSVSYDVYLKVSQGWQKVGNVKGADGADGGDGQNGADGQDGANGKDGADGQNGSDGKDGENGQDGQDGKDGAAWHCGAGTPDVQLGAEGDFYLDTESFDLYRRAAAWEKLGNIRGEDAARGKVTISYDAGAGAFEIGGSVYAEEITAGDYASLPVPVREGYVFAGWYCGEGANAARLTALTPVTKNLTLSARWLPCPKTHFITDSAFQASEGDLLPAGQAEIRDLYGVLYYNMTVNGKPSDDFFCNVTQPSLGCWRIEVGSRQRVKIGFYEVAVTLYGEFGETTVRFSYTVTAAPVLDFTQVLVDGQENHSEIVAECGESYEIELVLESSYSGVTHKIVCEYGEYAVTESENTFNDNDQFFLTVLCSYEQDSIRIKLSIVFLSEGDYALNVISEAEGAKATFLLHFHATI